MRAFSLIMAVIILIQSWMPCKDDVFAMKGDKTKTEISKTSRHNSQDHSDTCSPFCQCACCAGFSFNHMFGSVSTLEIKGDRHFTSYSPGNIIEISLPIWQPPQLLS
ncbi:DUF6660 family protein [Puia sp. P3]|uniref:DUF6660 family protein n=1 Tax=Puia sp. P3 TaxID=3423952 RepID=UPI003D66BABB